MNHNEDQIVPAPLVEASPPMTLTQGAVVLAGVALTVAVVIATFIVTDLLIV